MIKSVNIITIKCCWYKHRLRKQFVDYRIASISTWISVNVNRYLVASSAALIIWGISTLCEMAE